ncbi:MAG TPA: DUF2442 domain-containing protein, partial [Lamprocystis sp. (in: g-proteobacteria)]|nr:DUF2442 domain-containing protein [Lamprocystis sp. (in: g-proteobacteria)]
NSSNEVNAMLLDVIKVEAAPDYSLVLEFENGERRWFDMTPFMDQEPWSRIIPIALFRQASVGLGTVVWPGNIDIAPETLYLDSTPLETNPP